LDQRAAAKDCDNKKATALTRTVAEKTQKEDL
jgi:hypothetical protein